MRSTMSLLKQHACCHFHVYFTPEEQKKITASVSH